MTKASGDGSKDRKILLTMPVSSREKFLAEEAEERLALLAKLDKNETSKPLPDQEISRRIKDVDAVIVAWGDEGLSEENLKHAEKLQIIGVIGASVKKIQPEIVFKRNITVVNVAHICGDITAEHTLALLLASTRKIVKFNEGMKAGKYCREPWQPVYTSDWDIGCSLWGKNIGLVGMGIIGIRMVEMLRPFKVNIRAYSTHFPADETRALGVELVSLNEIMGQSDIISLHAGLREETINLIGEQELNLIKDGALFINTARGRIVDEEALISVLKKKKIFAALDVFIEQPLSANSELRRLPNVILTPHIAGNSNETWYQVGISIAEDFELFFSGEAPLHTLNAARALTMT